MLVRFFKAWFNRGMKFDDRAEMNRNKQRVRKHVVKNMKQEKARQPHKPVVLSDLPAENFILVWEMFMHLAKHHADQQHTFFLFEAERRKYSRRTNDSHKQRPFKIQKKGYVQDFPELRKELGDKFFENNSWSSVCMGKRKNVTFYYIRSYMEAPENTRGKLSLVWFDYCGGPVNTFTEQPIDALKKTKDAIHYVTYLLTYRRGGPDESPWNYHSLLRRLGLGPTHANTKVIGKFIMEQCKKDNVEMVTRWQYLGGGGNGTNMALLGFRSHGRIQNCNHLEKVGV